MRTLIGFVAGAALLALPLIGASAALPERDAAYAGALHISAAQQADGGFGGFGPGQTMDAIYAIRAAGFDPNTFVTGGNSPADYLEANAAGATTAAAAAKAALAAEALGLDPANVNGTDFIAVIEAAYDDTTGAYASDAFSQSLAIIGLAGTGNAVPAGAIDALRAAQVDDGGWGFGGASDTDTTAIVIQALVAAGIAPGDADLDAAIAYLQGAQGADGGWGFAGESNAAATAYAIQALIAAGENPESATYTQGGATPVSYLLAAQLPDGSFPGFDATYATIQVVPALAGRTFLNAPETDVTETLPEPTATATATATTPATSTTAAPTTAAATNTSVVTATPKPPKTGSGVTGEGEPTSPFVWIAAGLVLAGGGIALSVRHR